MECKKTYKQENVLEYEYSEDGKKLFKIRYDLDLDINSIFQPERLSPEAINKVYSDYKDCLSVPISPIMSKLFCGCDSPNNENK